MRYLLSIGLLLLIYCPVFSGEPTVNIYALSFEENSTNLGLEFSNFSDDGSLNILLAAIKQNEKLALKSELYVPEKGKLILFIRSIRSFPVNQLEAFIKNMGFNQITYKGELINTEALSEKYIPININREKAINKDEYYYRLRE